MMDEDVPVLEGLEDIGLLDPDALQPPLGDGSPWLALEIGTVERVDRPEAAQVEEAVDAVDVRGFELELTDEQAQHFVGHSGIDFESDDLRLALLPAQLVLDGGQQVRRFLVDQVEVGVACHPEGVLADDLHTGKQLAHVERNHLLERNEPLPVRQSDEARQQRRHLDTGEAHLVTDRVAHHHREVEREVRNVRKGMRRIHRERREHGENPGTKLGEEEVVSRLIEVGDRGDRDPLLLEGRCDMAREKIGTSLEEGPGPLVNGSQLLAGGHAVGRGLREGGVNLLLQAGDPDLEELVDVLAQDRQKPHPLEQRQRLVLGHGQHAIVEVELGKLPVQVARLRLDRGRLRGRGFNGCTLDGRC